MKLVVRNAVPLIAELSGFDSGVEAAFPPLNSVGGGEPRAAHYTGIRALMLAVLEEGIRNYLGHHERLRNEAGFWIASNGRRSPFSFGTVCETLGLEPQAVRGALQQLQDKKVTPRQAIGRSRPNVRNPGRLLARKAS
jgi:hypothetical protein